MYFRNGIKFLNICSDKYEYMEDFYFFVYLLLGMLLII